MSEPSFLDRAFLTGPLEHPGLTDILLVRHGQQAFPDPATARLEDWIDPPLSDLGRRQAAAVGEALAGEPVVAVHTSELARARDTGQAIAGHHGLEIVEHDDLAEIAPFAGLGEGSSPRELYGDDHLAALRRRFARERRWDVYPHTEASLRFRDRIVTAIERLATLHEGGTVVVACHGGVISALVADVWGLAVDMPFRPAHASVHRIRVLDGQREIHHLNEVHHLRPAGLLSY